MPLTYRSNATSTNSATCNKPSGVVSGDLLHAQVSFYDSGSAPTITPPSGWTLQSSGNGDTGAGSSWIRTYRKVAGGSEPTSYTWTISGSPYTDIAILRYDGQDATTPYDTGSGNGGNNTAPTGTGIDLAAANELVTWGLTGYDQTSVTLPGSFTQRASWDGVNRVADRTFASAGATGNQAGSTSGGQKWAVALDAYKEAAGAAATSLPPARQSRAWAPLLSF